MSEKKTFFLDLSVKFPRKTKLERLFKITSKNHQYFLNG